MATFTINAMHSCLGGWLRRKLLNIAEKSPALSQEPFVATICDLLKSQKSRVCLYDHQTGKYKVINSRQ